MSQKRRCSQQNQPGPLGERKTAGSKGCHKIRKFCNQDLKRQTDAEGGKHQPVFQVIHAENTGFHIAHADGMEKLGNAEHGEGIGLAPGQDLRHVQENF